MSKRVNAAVAAVVVLWSGAAAAQQTTYSFVGPTYDGFALFPPTAPNCAPVGGCADYTVAERITGSFTTAAPLPPNLSLGAVSPTAYSFSDGINTIASTDPAARVLVFQVLTDGSGRISIVNMTLERWRDGQASGHSAGAPNSTNLAQRFNSIQISGSRTQADNQFLCSAYTSAGDLCTNVTGDSYLSEANGSGMQVWTSASASAGPVPTLGDSIMAALAAALAVAGLYFVVRRPVREAC